MSERLTVEEAWREFQAQFPDTCDDPALAFEAGWDYGWENAQAYFATGGSFR